MRSRLGGVMRSPRIMLALTFRPPLHWPNFASPAGALLALLALLGWPLTADAQWPSGPGAQQSPPAPTAQQAPPAAGDQQVASAQRSLPAAQQPLSAEDVIEKIMVQEQTEVGLVRQYSPLVET